MVQQTQVRVPQDLDLSEAEGIFRRYSAGVRSLLERSAEKLHISVEPEQSGVIMAERPFKDFDMTVVFFLGDDLTREYSDRRPVRAVFDLSYHISNSGTPTRGGKISPRVNGGRIWVKSLQSDEITEFELRPQEVALLQERVEFIIFTHAMALTMGAVGEKTWLYPGFVIDETLRSIGLAE